MWVRAEHLGFCFLTFPGISFHTELSFCLRKVSWLLQSSEMEFAFFSP